MRTFAFVIISVSIAMSAIFMIAAIYFACVQDLSKAGKGFYLSLIMATQILVGMRILDRHPKPKA